MAMLRGELVQNDAKEMRPDLVERFNRPLCYFRSRLTGIYHENHAVHLRSQNDRVRHREHGRAVENHHIEMLLEQFYESLHPQRTQ